MPGTVSGTMNMAGNLGSFVTALAFPYLLKWTGTHNTFFYVGAASQRCGRRAHGWWSARIASWRLIEKPGSPLI